MKRMLFIIPWSSLYIGNTYYDFANAPERAPEGVVGLATYLMAQGAPVKIADMQQILRCNDGDTMRAMNTLCEICVSFKPDVIGFSFFTARFESTKAIFDSLWERLYDEKTDTPLIIAGGVHPTLLPQLTFSYIPFDGLCIGEGEIPLLRLLKGEQMENIKGFFLPEMQTQEYPDVISCLDDIPFPDWSLVDISFYTQPSYQISKAELHRVMPITFGRGCKYRCNFCAHNCFLHARCHSPEYFIEKMNHVAHQCGISTFVIQDSSIGNFRNIWEEVCRRLINMGSPYRWWANLRVNQADEEFLRLMKAAGCIKLFFGFESGSQQVLDRMNKRITVEQCLYAAHLCHKIGIPFYTSYIVNYFGETEEDLEKTERLIRETNPTSLAVNMFSPIPGSIDYDCHIDTIEPHIKTIHDWSMLGMLNIQLLFGAMPQERFEYWYDRLCSLKKHINSHETVIAKI